MFRSFRWSPVTMVVVAAVAAVAVGGSALTANITAPAATNAGQAVTVVEGFTVTKVQYETDGTSSDVAAPLVDRVKFTIVRNAKELKVVPSTPAAGDTQNARVWLQLRVGTQNSTWVECIDEASADNEVLCTTSDLITTLKSLTGLSVVAYDLKTAT